MLSHSPLSPCLKEAVELLLRSKPWSRQRTGGELEEWYRLRGPQGLQKAVCSVIRDRLLARHGVQTRPCLHDAHRSGRGLRHR